MNRKFIMGETFQDAMLKNIGTQRELSERDKLNWIDNIPIIKNPLSISSGDLELRLFTYKNTNTIKQVRELTKMEERCLNFVSRLYKPYELKIIDNIFAIEFTLYDMDVFYNKIRLDNTVSVSPTILNNKKIWRVILLENINDYILRISLEKLDINQDLSKQIMNGLENLNI
jgi:hypothetical protein